jgi:hypothetical protein
MAPKQVAKAILLAATLMATTVYFCGCSVYESQGRKDFEDSRDFQVTVTSLDESKNPPVSNQLLLHCQNFTQDELHPQNTINSSSNSSNNSSANNCGVTSGVTKSQKDQIFFHKQLANKQTQICKPDPSYSSLTFDQFNFFKNSFCELENN